MKTCPSCNTSFEPRKHFNSTIKSKYCDLCTKTRQALKNLERIKKEDKKRLNDKKKELLTVQDWIKITQATFNKYIRLRDKEKGCISCGNKLGSKFDAGHYMNANNHWNVRFNELNVNGQCVACNQHKHGNLIEYRKRLVKLIGVENVEWLEEYAKETRKFTVAELMEINELYKAKIKNLK